MRIICLILNYHEKLLKRGQWIFGKNAKSMEIYAQIKINFLCFNALKLNLNYINLSLINYLINYKINFYSQNESRSKFVAH